MNSRRIAIAAAGAIIGALVLAMVQRFLEAPPVASLGAPPRKAPPSAISTAPVTAEVHSTTECAALISVRNDTAHTLKSANLHVVMFERDDSRPVARSHPRKLWTRVVGPHYAEEECWHLEPERPPTPGATFVVQVTLDGVEFYPENTAVSL